MVVTELYCLPGSRLCHGIRYYAARLLGHGLRYSGESVHAIKIKSRATKIENNGVVPVGPPFFITDR